jgi:heme oxygenase
MVKSAKEISNDDILTALEDFTRITSDRFDRLKAQTNDIHNILDRLVTLEKKERLSQKERAGAQTKLQILIDWAQLAAKEIGVPLKLPSSR